MVQSSVSLYVQNGLETVLELVSEVGLAHVICGSLASWVAMVLPRFELD